MPIAPPRRQPTRNSQVRARATGTGPGGISTASRHPSNHAPEEQASIPRPLTPCLRPLLSAAGEYLSRTLELYAKQRTNRNDMRLSQGDLYAAMKLDRAFEAAERGPCQTTRDFNAVLARLENLTGDLVENLWPLSALGVSFSRPVGWHLNPFWRPAVTSS